MVGTRQAGRQAGKGRMQCKAGGVCMYSKCVQKGQMQVQAGVCVCAGNCYRTRRARGREGVQAGRSGNKQW